MHTVLVVANETLGGRSLIAAVRKRKEKGDVRFVLCVPRTRPKTGLVVYDDAVFDAAQVRVDLAMGFVHAEGLDAVGEVGDPDPYTATMDAVLEYHPDEIIISTYPETRSGWQRRDLVERVSEASGLPVEHVTADPDNEGLPFRVTLVVANRTATGDEVMKVLMRQAEADTKLGRLFVVLVPLEGGDGAAVQRARTRLHAVVNRLRHADLLAAGMIGDPDPYTAIMNTLQYFRVDDIVISTLPETKSGWLRADLVERVRKATQKPVEHVVHGDPVPANP
jgi:hypothetical protein